MDIQHELRVNGPKDILKKFYDDNKVSSEDIKINPLLFPNEAKLSFEKCISTAPLYILHKLHSNGNSESLLEKGKSITREDLVAFLWGTRYNASNISVKKSDELYIYHFTTKDTSPLIWFYAISRKYIHLTFEVIVKKSDSTKKVYHFIRGDLTLMPSTQESTVETKTQVHNPFFTPLIAYMKEKKIDAKKYMKRIYQKHLEGAENNVENIDYEGVVEDFIEKVKLGKKIKETQSEDIIYEKSRAFVESILQ